MVDNGFYYVVFMGVTTIARCVNNKWTMCGNVNTYDTEDFDDIDKVNCIYCL
jgi:hypothetical protein